MISKVVRLKEDTIRKIENLGSFGQSYDDVIKKLLEPRNWVRFSNAVIIHPDLEFNTKQTIIILYVNHVLIFLTGPDILNQRGC